MEARTSRNGKVVDTIGWYNPLVKENSLSMDMDKYREWIKKGAQPSDSVLRFVLTNEEKAKKWPSVEKKPAPAKESK
jgi:small subunit ribosomal protein S16